MTEIEPLKIELPDDPIDEFEIRYFTIECERVQEVVLKYHINSKWSDVCPDDGQGADFIDAWQYIADGRFEGRSVGWLTPTTFESKDRYAVRQDAVTVLKNRLQGICGISHQESARVPRESRAGSLIG